MIDIRCPRCGSLMGRADGVAQFRCHKARCFAIVDVNTAADEMVLIRFGSGANVNRAHKKFRVSEIAKKHQDGYFKLVRP